MDAETYWFPAYFVLQLFVAAFGRKFWPIAIVASLALVGLYPSVTLAGFVCLFEIPALILSAFAE